MSWFYRQSWKRKDISMDEDLNVGNLLETRAERAPRTESSELKLVSPTYKHKQAAPVGLAIAVVVVAVAVLVISGNRGRKVHVMERY
jgi:hypothetical protein